MCRAYGMDTPEANEAVSDAVEIFGSSVAEATAQLHARLVAVRADGHPELGREAVRQAIRERVSELTRLMTRGLAASDLLEQYEGKLPLGEVSIVPEDNPTLQRAEPPALMGKARVEALRLLFQGHRMPEGYIAVAFYPWRQVDRTMVDWRMVGEEVTGR